MSCYVHIFLRYVFSVPYESKNCDIKYQIYVFNLLTLNCTYCHTYAHICMSFPNESLLTTMFSQLVDILVCGKFFLIPSLQFEHTTISSLHVIFR